METCELSRREEEIVELSGQGLTTDAIAQRLDLSEDTINMSWLRIKVKAGGSDRSDALMNVIKEGADRALRDANVERKGLADIVAEVIAEKEQKALELRASAALLNLAMDQIKSSVWATDMDLSIHIIANGGFPSTHCGVTWEVGRTVYEIFKTKDPADLAVAAHLAALGGAESEVRLEGQFGNMMLRVIPLGDESGKTMGCISILNSVGG